MPGRLAAALLPPSHDGPLHTALRFSICIYEYVYGYIIYIVQMPRWPVPYTASKLCTFPRLGRKAQTSAFASTYCLHLFVCGTRI